MKYTALNEELFIRFLEAYKQFYIEQSGNEPDGVYWANFVAFVNINMKNPECLFLLAVEGKRVRGFVLAYPIPVFDGIKTVCVDPFYVFPEYRDKKIGLNLLNILDGWCKQKGYKRMMGSVKLENAKIWLRKTKLLTGKPKVLVLERFIR